MKQKFNICQYLKKKKKCYQKSQAWFVNTYSNRLKSKITEKICGRRVDSQSWS